MTDENGRLVVIPEYPHAHSEYISAFISAGLRIVGCHEPELTAEQAREEAKAGLEEAFELALTGFPVVIVWDLVVRLMLGTNVESKTRCQDLEAVARLASVARRTLRGAARPGRHVLQGRRGRLKLREIAHHSPDGEVSESSELIGYERPDESGARVSSYERTVIEDGRRP